MNRHLNRTNAVTLAALLLFGTVGCSDGSNGTGPSATLSADQAEKVAQAVSQQAFEQDFSTVGSASLSSGDTEGGVSAGVQAATTGSFTFSRNCNGGGSVTWTIEEFFASQSRDSVSVDGALEYARCTATVDGSTVEVTTTPEFVMTATILRPSQSEVEWNSGLNGSLDWTLEGDTGSCTLDLETRGSATGVDADSSGSIDASTTGEVCGHQVDRSFSIEAQQ